MLAGDVSGKDGLRLADYVAAADSVAGKLGQTARQVVARFKTWLIVAFLVAAGGIVLIFVGTKREADDITKYLRQDGWPALAIHGDKEQYVFIAIVSIN